jgi:hypothetical protein
LSRKLRRRLSDLLKSDSNETVLRSLPLQIRKTPVVDPNAAKGKSKDGNPAPQERLQGFCM